MTDHTRTEKIGGDSILFLRSSKSSGKPLWQLGDSAGENRESYQYLVICCLPCCFACLIYLFSFYDLFMAFYFVIFEYLWCHLLFCLWIRVDRLSAHTHVHLHTIISILELRPFRKKCWLRSREIIISVMASQTLPESIVLITSWGNNLRIVIKKCSHSNRTLSTRNLWWVRIGVPY